jgi:hypothetical protein
MMNFFAATNLTDGSVTGCLTPTLPTVCSSSSTEHDALVHAKPILIQGAWLAASAPGGDPLAFEQWSPAMQALLAFWDRPPRRDNATGLRVWHDQMESGSDNCVLSQCPNRRSPCWTDSQAFSLASADVTTLLQREHLAFSLFADAWSEHSHSASPERSLMHRTLAARHRERADALTAELNAALWRADLGYHVALNTSSREVIAARTYVIAFPLWAGLVNATQARLNRACPCDICSGTERAAATSAPGLGSPVPNFHREGLASASFCAGTGCKPPTHICAGTGQANAIAATLSADDMLSEIGLRSTSASDPRCDATVCVGLVSTRSNAAALLRRLRSVY